MEGLSSTEAAERLARIGPNALPERAPDPAWAAKTPLERRVDRLGWQIARWVLVSVGVVGVVGIAVEGLDRAAGIIVFCGGIGCGRCAGGIAGRPHGGTGAGGRAHGSPQSRYPRLSAVEALGFND